MKKYLIQVKVVSNKFFEVQANSSEAALKELDFFIRNHETVSDVVSRNGDKKRYVYGVLNISKTNGNVCDDCSLCCKDFTICEMESLF